MKYTEDHEWVRAEGDADAGLYRVGITDYAQRQLGDIVYVELPTVGDIVAAGMEAAVVESVKAAGDVKSPLSGTVTEVNAALDDAPEKVNQAPESDGWFFTVRAGEPAELDALMDADAYQKLVDELG